MIYCLVILLHGHLAESISLKRCRYALMFPWQVIIVVRLWLVDIFIFNLSITFGKQSLVIVPLVVWFQSLCHLSTLKLSTFNVGDCNSVRQCAVNFLHGETMKWSYALNAGLIWWEEFIFLPPEGRLVKMATAGKLYTRKSGKFWWRIRPFSCCTVRVYLCVYYKWLFIIKSCNIQWIFMLVFAACFMFIWIKVCLFYILHSGPL